MKGNIVQWNKSQEICVLILGLSQASCVTFGKLPLHLHSWLENEKFGVDDVVSRFLPARKLYNSI